MLHRLSPVLNEPVMGFLALAALSLGLAPLLFNLPERVNGAFDGAQWLIVALFSAEYAVHLALSADRRAFILNPWRLLDAVIIVAAFLSLVVDDGGTARTIPALRLLRLVPVILFGLRVTQGVHQQAAPPPRPRPVGPPIVTALRAGESGIRTVDWTALLEWIAAPHDEWLHVSNLTNERLPDIAAASGVPPTVIAQALHELSYPRIETVTGWTALTIAMPSRSEAMYRDPVLLLFTTTRMLSLAAHPVDIHKLMEEPGEVSWGPRCVLRVIRLVLSRDEEIAGEMERILRRLEVTPAHESSKGFFEQAFRLKRILSMAKSDLWRLHRLLEKLVDGRVPLPDLDTEQREAVRRLAEEAEYLYETFDDIRESVISLIDLHINVAAHETNRFMRLLAIVSTLSLIPALAGGLLGMNLVDSPWPVTLPQVAFGTFVLMLGVLYIFIAKAWLR